MKYEYINENEIQYDVSAFEEGKPVKARYRRSKNSMDEGNPFIEALPMCREGKETIKAYTLSVNGMLDSIGGIEVICFLMYLYFVRFVFRFLFIKNLKKNVIQHL